MKKSEEDAEKDDEPQAERRVAGHRERQHDQEG